MRRSFLLSDRKALNYTEKNRHITTNATLTSKNIIIPERTLNFRPEQYIILQRDVKVTVQLGNKEMQSWKAKRERREILAAGLAARDEQEWRKIRGYCGATDLIVGGTK